MGNKIFDLGKLIYYEKPNIWVIVLNLCVLLFLLDTLFKYISNPRRCKVSRMEPQDFIDTSEKNHMEIYDHKTDGSGAILLKAKNEYVKAKYVRDTENSIQLYCNGEINHVAEDIRKKNAIETYKSLTLDFTVARCGDDYIIISKVEDTLLVLSGEYKNRHRILRLAKEYNYVPKTNFKNECKW